MEHQTWYICSVCKSYTRSNYKSVLGHMRIHKFDPNLSLKCGINSCPEEYTVYESFRSHVYRKHRELLYTDTTNNEEDQLDTPEAQVNIQEDNDNGDENQDDAREDTNENMNFKRMAASFLLKIHEEHKVTQTALNVIVHDTKELWRHTIQNIKVTIQKIQRTFMC